MTAFFDPNSFSIEGFKTILSNRGYQRSDRYQFLIFPAGVENQLGLNLALLDNGLDSLEFAFELTRRTTKLSLPNQSLATNNIVSSGIDYESPYKLNFDGNFEFTFLNDREGSLVRVFKSWIDNIFNKRTGNFEYRKSYVCDSQIIATDTTGQQTLVYDIKEMYPKSYTVSDFSSDTNLQEVTVTMNYKYFDISPDGTYVPPRNLESGVDFADFGGSTPQFPGDGTAFT